MVLTIFVNDKFGEAICSMFDSSFYKNQKRVSKKQNEYKLLM